MDVGSTFVKLGLAGEDRPRCTFPAVVGRIIRHGHNLPHRQYVVGDEAQARHHLPHFVQLIRPVERGRLAWQPSNAHWNDVEGLWHHALYNELRMAPEEQPMLLSESPLATQYDIERAAEEMFEALNVPSLHIMQDSALAVLGTGRTTGLALSIGGGLTSAVPVYEGHALTHHAVCMPLAGADITELLHRLIQPRGLHYADHARDPLERAKEALAYVAEDLAAERRMSRQELLRAATDAPLTLSHERFECTEVLFDPSLLGLSGVGVHTAAADAIAKCSPEVRAEMWDNVILYGGSAKLPGIAQRLLRELRQVAPVGMTVRLIRPEEPAELVFYGGSVVASLPQFGQMCTTMQEWEESRRVILRKCSI